jgi:hypothetical protein
MSAWKSYLLPACAATLVAGGALTYCSNFSKPAAVPRPKEAQSQVLELPHGRVLYVVVEEEGVYVGDDFVTFGDFENFLKGKVRALHPDFAKVGGTETARYGKVIQVYAAVRNVLSISATLETSPFERGFRRGPIEVHEHSWEY